MFRKNLISIFNNQKLKTKFLLIYVFCILIPLSVSNFIIIYIVIDSEKKQSYKIAENTADAIHYKISNTIDDALSITIKMYTNKILNDFLDKNFENNIDFYNEYMQLTKNKILDNDYGQYISNYIFYSNNSSLVTGGKLADINSIENEQWYISYLNSNRNLYLYSYYDINKRIYNQIADVRTISVIHKLDYYNKEHVKLVKLDLNYSLILQDIINANYENKIYICNSDKIILSNDEESYTASDFVPKSNINFDNFIINKPLSFYGQTWDIYIMPYKLNSIQIIIDNIALIIILFCADLFVPVFFMYMINKSITERLLILNSHLNEINTENFKQIDMSSSNDEIGNLINNYNLTVKKIDTLIHVVYVNKLAKQELILAKKQAELLALQSQINPHFMFNSLESIRMRSLIKNEKETSEIIAKLAILIRQSIYWGNDIITIEEEIKYVKAYLEIQKYRFDEKLSFYINVCEKCLKINIPKITLVTFVENSCIHGIEHTSKKGSIIIDISIFQDNIEIVIEDTGKGMDENKLSNLINQVENANILMLDKSNSIGIINAFIRLKTYFKDNIKFNITSELNKGTKINLTISLRDIE